MRVRHDYSLPGFIFGLLLVLALPAQAQMGGLEGEVKDYDDKPMADVTVQIERTDISGKFETKTDSKGHYIYTGLAAGRATYTIRLLKDGNILYELRGVKISGGETRRVDFNLKQLREEQEKQMTEEQKRQRAEALKAMEKDKSLRGEFDLGLKLMREDGWCKVLNGYTTVAQADLLAEHLSLGPGGYLGDSRGRCHGDRALPCWQHTR